MPNVSTLLSGGVSVGILAGVVSGLFYLVVAGIRWAGKLKANAQEEQKRLEEDSCCECRRPLPVLPSKRKICDQCGQRACRECGSAEEGQNQDQWYCASCSRKREVKLQSGEWFFKQVQRRFSTVALTNTNHKSDDGEGMDPESAQVREFIERLVEKLVAGGLDNVCIKRLHLHSEYERMFACYHASLCEALARLAFTLQMAIANKPMPETESPSAAHSALKQLIQKIIQEAMTLPTLQEFENSSLNRSANEENGVSAEDMNSKTYEDILATAILNKVIERYQKTGGLCDTNLDGNSNLLTTTSMEPQPKYISRLEIGINNSPDSLEDENASSSSLHEDCNMSESSITDPLSLTIEECIEEVTTYSRSGEEEEEEEEEEDEPPIAPVVDSGSRLNFYLSNLDFIQHHRVPFPELGMDIVDGPPLDLSDQDEEDAYSDDDSSPQPTDLVSPVDSWEENWLFQRRRLKGGGVPQPTPVPMLVPNPSEDYRALIGDRDAEEYSDLSDCSDGALEDVVLAEGPDQTANKDLMPVVSEELAECTDTVQAVDVPDSARDINLSVWAVPCITVESMEDQSDSDECNVDTTDNGVTMFKVQESETNGQTGEYSSLPEQDLELSEAKNVELYKSSLDCLSEFGQKDSEYTEDYTSVAQRQMDSLSGSSEPELPVTPVPLPRALAVLSDNSMHPLLPDEDSLHQDNDQSQDIPDELAMPPRPGIDQSDDENCTLPCTGTIAEREHKKWESAPPLPNNPYSSENISKRLSKRISYNSRSSSSDTSVEFPELKTEAIIGKVIEKPLQIVCAPDDLDYKRYGRDYYINSKAASHERKAPLASPSVSNQQSQENYKSETEISPLILEPEFTERATEEKDETENNITQVTHLVESEIARWQKEINQTEQQWIRKQQPTTTRLEANVDKPESQINRNTTSQRDVSNKMKSSTKSWRNEEISRYPSVILGKQKNIDKRQQVPQEDSIYGKSSFKQIKFPVHQEPIKSPEVNTPMRNGGTKYIINKEKPRLLDESSIEFLNGSGRSYSPSEASVVSSDSDLSHNMPSVKELTKHFATIADSDSSSSTPKCVSPAPKWRPTESQKVPAPVVQPTPRTRMSSSRPVREVHSLTARSISREFREGLRRQQPSPLDRNVYNQSGSDSSPTRLISNGTSAEGYTSDEMDAPPPIPTSNVPPQSMRSNIIFWEQMQHSNS